MHWFPQPGIYRGKLEALWSFWKEYFEDERGITCGKDGEEKRQSSKHCCAEKQLNSKEHSLDVDQFRTRSCDASDNMWHQESEPWTWKPGSGLDRVKDLKAVSYYVLRIANWISANRTRGCLAWLAEIRSTIPIQSASAIRSVIRA